MYRIIIECKVYNINDESSLKVLKELGFIVYFFEYIKDIWVDICRNF